MPSFGFCSWFNKSSKVLNKAQMQMTLIHHLNKVKWHVIYSLIIFISSRFYNQLHGFVIIVILTGKRYGHHTHSASVWSFVQSTMGCGYWLTLSISSMVNHQRHARFLPFFHSECGIYLRLCS